MCYLKNRSLALINSFVSETSIGSIRTRRYLKNVIDNAMIILNIKLHFICKCHPHCNYHQYSLGIPVTRFMFSNKRVIPQPWSGLMPKNNVKEVFIEPRERWHWAIVQTTKHKTTDNNHKTE